MRRSVPLALALSLAFLGVLAVDHLPVVRAQRTRAIPGPRST